MLSDDLLSGAKAAADYMGVPPRTVYNMVEKDLIPFIKKGKNLFFRKSELDAAFSSEAA
jgi:excisionase family DNA binding protein